MPVKVQPMAVGDGDTAQLYDNGCQLRSVQVHACRASLSLRSYSSKLCPIVRSGGSTRPALPPERDI